MTGNEYQELAKRTINTELNWDEIEMQMNENEIVKN